MPTWIIRRKPPSPQYTYTGLRTILTKEQKPNRGLAVLDEGLRRRLLAEAREILEELKTRDPGGDVVL